LFEAILQLAARTLEDEVAAVLAHLVSQGTVWSKEEVDRLLKPEPIVVPLLETGSVDLHQYDQLLEEWCDEPA
jgi:hypothetical protein